MNTNRLKAIIPNVIIGIFAIVTIAAITWKMLFLIAGIITILYYRQSFEWENGRLLAGDFWYLISIMVTVGCAYLIFFGICQFFPLWDRCALSEFRATGFAIISFPIMIGFVLWVITRLPKIIKTILKR